MKKKFIPYSIILTFVIIFVVFYKSLKDTNIYTPDPITQIGLAIPLLILYELSIFSVKFIESKNLKNLDA